MELLAIAYSIACFVQLIAGIPQLLEIIRERSSRELSLLTWGGWLAAQFICLLYITSLGNKVLITVSCAWMVYYFAMVSVIIYYRHPRFAPVVVAEEPADL